jgi:PAS domain S-box-containing protein
MLAEAHVTNSSNHELLELIIESATDIGIFTIDEAGLVTSWNPGAERMFGFRESEMMGASADVVFTSEDRAAGAPEKERLDGRTKGRALDDRWHQRKDGSKFWASGLLMPLKRTVGFVKITRDRTEQHQANTRLRESEERFRLLATSIPQLVFLTRPDGFRTWPSPQWISFTGLGFDESLGFGWLSAIHPDDRTSTQNAWDQARTSGEYFIEHRVRRNMDGAFRWHQTRAKALGDGSNSSVPGEWVGTMTDIHDLRTMHDRQQVLMAELQHRTRNLLAVVHSIASRTVRTSESLKDFGSVFDSRLRSLSRVQSLLAKIEDEDIDLKTLVGAELAAHTEIDTGAGKVELVGPPVVLPAMAAQALGLALHELATNATKYGALAQPSGKLKVSWHLDRETSPPLVTLRWLETGVTMPDAAPRRKGYGSELIERALPYQLQAESELCFDPTGVRCAIRVPLEPDRASNVR